MRWIPPQVKPGLAAYNTVTVSWAAATVRTYVIFDTATQSLIQTTAAPTDANKERFVEFIVPEHADLFGIELTGTLVSASATVTSWTIHKFEVWAVGPGQTSADITFNVDSGLNAAPILLLDGKTAVNRRAVDISDFSEPIFEVGTTATIHRQILWISGTALGPLLNGEYGRVYILPSFDPSAATPTASYTLRMRPIAVTLNSRESRR